MLLFYPGYTHNLNPLFDEYTRRDEMGDIIGTICYMDNLHDQYFPLPENKVWPELWVKADVYKITTIETDRSSLKSDAMRLYFNNSSDTVSGFDFLSDHCTHYIGPISKGSHTYKNAFKDSEWNNVELHFINATSNGKIELYINGNLEWSIDENSGKNIYSVLFQSRYRSMIRNLIVADFDISDYYAATAPLKIDAKTMTEDETNKTLKAAAVGDYVKSHIDYDKLAERMSKDVTSPEIVGVSIGSYNFGRDTSVINSVKTTINNTDIETLTLSDNDNASGTLQLTNPATGAAWTLNDLKTDTFTLTAEKA